MPRLYQCSVEAGQFSLAAVQEDLHNSLVASVTGCISYCVVGRSICQVFLQFSSQSLPACFVCFSVCRIAFCSVPYLDPISHLRDNKCRFIPSPFFCHSIPRAFCVFTASWNGKLMNLSTRIYLASAFFLPVGGGHWGCKAEASQNRFNSAAQPFVVLMQMALEIQAGIQSIGASLPTLGKNKAWMSAAGVWCRGRRPVLFGCSLINPIS